MKTEVVPVVARDGRVINVEHVTGDKKPTKSPVLLVHGAGVRANIFRAPVERTIVETLLDEGYDVWLENWRASIDLMPCEWTLDDAAVNDHPAAVDTILDITKAETVKAIVHCQGSTSFVMSAAAGLLPRVDTIVSNAVSFHPIIPAFSRFKIHVTAPLVSLIRPYMNPAWGLDPPDTIARALVGAVRLIHHECNNIVCRMVSFTYGTGFPALWSHENLNDQTHSWLTHEFANVPFTFFSQMAKSVWNGSLVHTGRYAQLPSDFAAQPPQTDARFVLLAGKQNKCFLPESQERTFRFLDDLQKGRHSLHVFDNYGHLDMFMGKRASADIFPTILEELERS